MRRSSFSRNKAVLKKLLHMREGKLLFENKSLTLNQCLRLVEIFFSGRFSHPDEYLWVTAEEIISLCLCHTTFINFSNCMYHKQKNSFSTCFLRLIFLLTSLFSKSALNSIDPLQGLPLGLKGSLQDAHQQVPLEKKEYQPK